MKKKQTNFVPYANPVDNIELADMLRKEMVDSVDEDEFEFIKQAKFKEIDQVMSGEKEIDYHGCDHFFLGDFITNEMGYDFPLIAKDFLKHEYENLSDYDQGYYVEYYPGESSPIELIENRVLNLMYGAAKKGNPYAVSLFKYLYKTCYKNEYKQLKRFRQLSLEEVLALAGNHIDDSDSAMHVIEMARILTMARFFNIDIKKENYFIYRLLNRQWDSFERWKEEADAEYLTIERETYEKAAELVADLISKNDDSNKDIREQAD